MIIPALQRHLAICGQPQLATWLRKDPQFWHVISIRESYRPLPEFQLAKRHVTLFFEDREELEKDGSGVLARPQHLASAFEFADAQPQAPLLIHCWAGRSRSTALALAFIVRGMKSEGRTDELIVTESADLLLTLRPSARPNFQVLRLGLEQFMPVAEARALATLLVNEPRLLNNRFIPD